MNSVVSATVTNFATGAVNVVLSTALGAGEAIWLDRRPTFDYAPFAATVTSSQAVSAGMQYTITIPGFSGGNSPSGLWWIETQIGGTAHTTPRHLWVKPSFIATYTAGGLSLVAILESCKPAIDALLQEVDAKLSYQSTIFGAEWNLSRKTPGILIKPYSCTETYEEEPYGRYVTMQYEMTGLIRQSDSVNEAQAISQLMQAVIEILNQRAYSDYVLTNGQPVNGGQSVNHTLADQQLENVWASRFTTVWQWEYIRMAG